jgi:hypothetical protein
MRRVQALKLKKNLQEGEINMCGNINANRTKQSDENNDTYLSIHPQSIRICYSRLPDIDRDEFQIEYRIE